MDTHLSYCSCGITERVAFTITDLLILIGRNDRLFRQVKCHDTVTACYGRQCNHMVTCFCQIRKVLVTVNSADTQYARIIITDLIAYCQVERHGTVATQAVLKDGSIVTARLAPFIAEQNRITMTDGQALFCFRWQYHQAKGYNAVAVHARKGMGISTALRQSLATKLIRLALLSMLKPYSVYGVPAHTVSYTITLASGYTYKFRLYILSVAPSTTDISKRLN